MITFNIDERSIISIYKGIEPNRVSTINRILSNINYVEEKDIKELMNTTAIKLKKINDEEFLTLDLENTLNEAFIENRTE